MKSSLMSNSSTDSATAPCTRQGSSRYASPPQPGLHSTGNCLLRQLTRHRLPPHAHVHTHTHLVAHHVADACGHAAGVDAHHLPPEAPPREQHQVDRAQAVPGEALVAGRAQQAAQQLLPLRRVVVLLLATSSVRGVDPELRAWLGQHTAGPPHMHTSSQRQPVLWPW